MTSEQTPHNPNLTVKVTLKPGREASALRRHPWIFSGAIKSVEGNVISGQTVEVFTADNRWIARGSYSAESQIRVRVLSYELDEHIDRAFFQRRISDAIKARQSLRDSDITDAFRLIYSESDGLPGLIADRYGDFLVCQFLSAGMEYWKDEIIGLLAELWPCRGIFERSDTESRKKEGLGQKTGLLWGEEPPEKIIIREGEMKFQVDVRVGHKTGFYLDQRDNRHSIAKYAHDKEVLNAFAYTGGFGIAASLAGARHVTHVDSSPEALVLADKNADLNGLDKQKMDFVQEDVFRLMRTYRDSRRHFDLIVLDPPKFVASANQLEGGARGYKDINLLALKLLNPEGILVTFSCSGYVSPELFRKIVADAALDAGKEARITEFLNQSPDHPVSLNFPESLYLKGLICQVHHANR